MSVVALKDHPPVAVPALNATLRTVLGYPYGIGPVTDSRGYTWTDGKKLEDPSLHTLADKLANFHEGHPVEVLSCDNHRDLGHTAETLGLIAPILAFVLGVLHVMAPLSSECCVRPPTARSVIDGKPVSEGPSLVTLLGLGGAVLKVVLVIALIVEVAVASALVTKPWHCQNALVPLLELEQHFEMQYGIGLLILSLSFMVVSALAELPTALRMHATQPTMLTAHAVTIVTAGVTANLLTSSVGDGFGLATLKDDPPVAPGLARAVLPALVGDKFGLGLTKDSQGHGWNDGSYESNLWSVPSVRERLQTGHILGVLRCDDHRRLGLAAAAMALGALACIGATLVLHCVAGFGIAPGRTVKLAGTALPALAAVFALGGMSCAAALYDRSYPCGNPLVTSLKIKDHFDLGPSAVLLAIVFLLALLCFVAALKALRSMAPDQDYVRRETQPIEGDGEEDEEDEEEEEGDEGG